MDRGDFNINNDQLVVSVSALLDAWMPDDALRTMTLDEKRQLYRDGFIILAVRRTC